MYRHPTAQMDMATDLGPAIDGQRKGEEEEEEEEEEVARALILLWVGVAGNKDDQGIGRLRRVAIEVLAGVLGCRALRVLGKSGRSATGQTAWSCISRRSLWR